MARSCRANFKYSIIRLFSMHAVTSTCDSLIIFSNRNGGRTALPIADPHRWTPRWGAQEFVPIGSRVGVQRRSQWGG